MRWPTRGFGASLAGVVALRVLAGTVGQTQTGQTQTGQTYIGQTHTGQNQIISAQASFSAASTGGPASIPTTPPPNSSSIAFRDGHYGVRFQVPPGWTYTRKDREVSTFRLDARSAPAVSEMRAVATMNFNPFPQSVLSGALVYFSVARHSNDRACAVEAVGAASAGSLDSDPAPASGDPQSIGGMTFLHGHDEHGGICVEARDEVYTAYRKGACYRFDLEVNTFCAVSSGAAELSTEQMHTLEAQMAGILSTVTLDWEKTGPQSVPTPEPTVDSIKPTPRHQLPETSPAQKPAVGRGA